MLSLRLFAIFFQVGFFTIGGGLASLPLLHREMVTSRDWITEAEFVDMIAVSQSTPGPIGINMATFVGYRLGSVPGALAATAGMVAPSLIVILLIARFLKGYAKLPAVEWALSGLRPAAVGMIAAAAWFILGAALRVPGAEPGLFRWDRDTMLLLLALGVAHARWRKAPVAYIALGGLAGVLLL